MVEPSFVFTLIVFLTNNFNLSISNISAQFYNIYDIIINIIVSVLLTINKLYRSTYSKISK